MTNPARRRGLGFIEVVVAVSLVGILMLILLVTVPRGRESARKTNCQRNLMQIGFALSLYDQSMGRLPTARLGGESPLSALLGDLGLADFRSLDSRKSAPSKASGRPPAERAVAGFVCPSDPHATSGIHRAPISYRATTGDTVDGRRGPFELGRTITSAEVESADGASFTAAFSERLVGGGRPVEALASYASVPGPPAGGSLPTAGALDWRGDAGSNWLKADWRSTLYNHAFPPGHSRSWIASDGPGSSMGASSGHPTGVHILMIDGSLKATGTSIDPGVWKSLSTVENPRR